MPILLRFPKVEDLLRERERQSASYSAGRSRFARTGAPEGGFLRIFRESSVVGASLCALTWAWARAEGESADPPQVEEVVVTAQRRQQNLQDVPVSVTAAGAAALAAAHVDDISNIKALSPGVSFTTNYNPAVTSNIQVRGVGTVFAAPGLWAQDEMSGDSEA